LEILGAQIPLIITALIMSRRTIIRHITVTLVARITEDLTVADMAAVSTVVEGTIDFDMTRRPNKSLQATATAPAS
jgi:hypothetical protein